MKTPEHAAFIGELKQFLDPTKEVKIYHFEFKKHYGDW